MKSNLLMQWISQEKKRSLRKFVISEIKSHTRIDASTE